MQPGPRTQDFHSTDPEAFGATATPSSQSRLVLRGRGPFEGWRSRFAPDSMVLNLGRTNRAATFHTAVGQRAIFSLPGGAGPDPLFQGQALPPAALAWWRADADIHTQWPADVPWWNLIFPLGRLSAAAGALFGVPLLLPRETVRFVPLPPAQRAALVSAMERARSAPGWVAGEVLSDGLLRLVLEVLGPKAGGAPQAGAAGPDVPSCRRRHLVVDGLVAIADRTDEQPSLLQVCAELRVPLRTLNACSNAVLGVSAALYLRRRRLSRVFSDLRRGAAASVTDAAMRHGFWELGRFAASYRELFGETPSATLRRAGRR